MKRTIFNYSIRTRITERHVRIILAVAALTMFVLGAGAPGAFSG